MRTLIELYDTSPIRNVLATVMFRPQEMILICPPEVAEDPNQKRSLRDFFAYLNCPVKLTLIPVTLLDAGKTERVLREVLESHQDCAIDISGGTDAALFAAGVASGDTPVFTYSVRKDTFFEIKNAPFARSLPNTVHLDVRSCLMMAGGTLLPGREDNAGLAEMSDRIDRLFRVYSAFRPQWNRQISYIQKISSAEPGVLEAGGQLREKAGNKNIDADGEFFGALEEAGLILNLQYTDESVSFRFPDERVRFWLRDVGAVLELQVFRACRAAVGPVGVQQRFVKLLRGLRRDLPQIALNRQHLAALAGTAKRILEAVFRLLLLGQVDAAHAELAAVEGVQRVALPEIVAVDAVPVNAVRRGIDEAGHILGGVQEAGQGGNVDIPGDLRVLLHRLSV